MSGQGYEQFRTKSEAELVKDLELAHRAEQAMLIITELRHRDAQRQTEEMLVLNRDVRSLTRIILALTIVNVVAVLVALFR